jgi:hypothetical protein
MFALSTLLTHPALVRLHLMECVLRYQYVGGKTQVLEGEREFLIHYGVENFKG